MTVAPDSPVSKTDLGHKNRQTSDLFRLLVDSVSDYAIFVLSPDGHVLTWNTGAQALKGYEKEEIIGQHFSKFYLPEAVQSGWPARELQLAEKEGRFADEGWRVRKDGSQFWAAVTLTPLRDSSGTLSGFAKVTQDMTDRREAAERIQELNRELRNRVVQLNETQRLVELRTLELQNLSGRVLNIQDEERRRLARDLHDDIGQQLTGIKMLMDRIQNKEASKAAEDALTTVRNLSYLLHPPLLDETGLRSALHWFIEGMCKRSGIDITLDVRPTNFPRLSSEIETAIFRVVQESLTNVFRHAQSQTAKVEIEKKADWVTVRVRDYGKGVTAELDANTRGPKMGVGIAGMRERLRQFGGDLVIKRAEPGTLVEARVPVFI